MMSQNHTLGVISRPKPVPAKAPAPFAEPQASQTKVFTLPSLQRSVQYTLLEVSVSHQSHWMEPRPLAVSPARQRYCRSR